MTSKVKTYFVNIYVTTRCNFKCRYCYVNSYEKKTDMSMETANELINYIKNSIKLEQKLIVNFHGGEPTINFPIIKYIIEVLENELSNSISFGITTNGSLLNDDMIDFLASKCDFNLSISLDGNEKTQTYNRKTNSDKYTFDFLMNNAMKLLKKNPKTRIRMTFDKENIDDLAENVIYFIEKGFKYVVPHPNIFSEDWSNEDFEKLENQMLEIKKFEIANSLHIPFVSSEFFCLSKCNSGLNYYSVDPEGNFYPCSFLIGKEEYIMGNSSKGIELEKLFEIQKKLKSLIHECDECALKDCCISYRCLFINYVTRGNLLKPNLVECNLINCRYNLSKKIISTTSYIREEIVD